MTLFNYHLFIYDVFVHCMMKKEKSEWRRDGKTLSPSLILIVFVHSSLWQVLKLKREKVYCQNDMLNLTEKLQYRRNFKFFSLAIFIRALGNFHFSWMHKTQICNFLANTKKLKTLREKQFVFILIGNNSDSFYYD